MNVFRGPVLTHYSFVNLAKELLDSMVVLSR
jgi:hypothetical protein